MVEIRIPDDGIVSDADWAAIESAEGLIYGSPTYMGNAAWQFKRFADASSKLWMQRALADRVAGGFTV